MMNLNITNALLFLFFTAYSFCTGCSATTAFDGTEKGLKVGFYNPTCPQAENIVKKAVADQLSFDSGIPAGLIRLFFQDCFVRGCDASILLDETPSGNPVEKSSSANARTLNGLDVIDNAKLLLESKCPNTVSCADILAFAARDAVVLAGLPSYPVPSGRRDGTISCAGDTLSLPTPTNSIQILTQKFAKKGFSEGEMVILSGAHSIGGARCSSFDYRLYNFTKDNQQDPAMNILYAELLKEKCPEAGSDLAQFASGQKKVNFIESTKPKLDASYYEGLLKMRGLLASDQALTQNSKTKKVVETMAKDPRRWAKQFQKAMIKLGGLDVLVGEQGEIRKTCRFVNK